MSATASCWKWPPRATSAHDARADESDHCTGRHDRGHHDHEEAVPAQRPAGLHAASRGQPHRTRHQQDESCQRANENEGLSQ